MNDALAEFGAFTFLLCATICFISLIMLILTQFQKDTDKQACIKRLALKMLIFSLIGGLVGFGVCFSNFELVLN